MSRGVATGNNRPDRSSRPRTAPMNPYTDRTSPLRKVYEVDPMTCPRCGGAMRVAFLTEPAVVDRIIEHLKLTFVAAKPPPSHVFTAVALMAAEESRDYF